LAIICHASKPPVIPPPLNFREELRKWQRNWLWDNLQWVGDDDWLAVAIKEESCIAVAVMLLTTLSAGAIAHSALLTKFAVTGRYRVHPGVLTALHLSLFRREQNLYFLVGAYSSST
jgi:hypothetical protein